MLSALRRFCRHEVDAGWAWVVCFASFFVQFVVFGTIQSFGTLFISLLQDFNSGESETAWVGSLAYGFLFVMGPLSTALCEHFGCRVMSCAGSILTAISLLLTSFATSIFSMYFTFGVLWGIGGSFLFFSGLLVLRFYFITNISLANGITMTGAGFGTLVFNVMLQELDETYGWRGGMRVLSVFAALTFLCGCLYLPPPAQHYNAAEDWSHVERSRLWYKLKRLIDPRPWRDRAFIVWTLSMSCILFAYFFPYTYLVRMAVSLDIPVSKGSLLLGYLSVSAIFGKLLCGRLADLPRVRRLYIFVTSTLVLSVSSMCVTAATNYDGLFAYALISGFFDGCFVVTVPLITQDIVGREQLANAIGSLYGVLAFPLTLGPPVLGELYKKTGSFTAAFFFSSGIILVGVSLIYIVQRIRPELTRRQEWPGPSTQEMYASNLIPDPSVQSMSVDTLSGMCFTEPGPSLPHLAHIEGTPYQRFDDFRRADPRAASLQLVQGHATGEAGIEAVLEGATHNTPNTDIDFQHLNRSETIAVPEIDVLSPSHSSSLLANSLSSTEHARDVDGRSVAEVASEETNGTLEPNTSILTLVNVNVEKTTEEEEGTGISGIEPMNTNGQYTNTCQEEAHFVILQSETHNLETVTFLPPPGETHQDVTTLSTSDVHPTAAYPITNHQSCSEEPNTVSSTLLPPLDLVIPNEPTEVPVLLTDLPELCNDGNEFMVENRGTIVPEEMVVDNPDVVAKRELVAITPPPEIHQRGKNDDAESPFNTHSEVVIDEKADNEEINENVCKSAVEDVIFGGSVHTLEIQEITSRSLSQTKLANEKDLHLEEMSDQAPEPLEIIRIPPPPGIPRTGQLVELEPDTSESHMEADVNSKGDLCRTACAISENDVTLTSEGIVGNDKGNTNTNYYQENICANLSLQEDEPCSILSSEKDMPGNSPVSRQASRPKERLHFAIIDQLSVLSERLEAVAARQIQEEQELGNCDATEQQAVFSPANYQSLALTPLYSANHSVPLTPVRAPSGFGSTTAPTPLHTPSSDLHTTGPTPTHTPLSDRRTPIFTPDQSISGIFDTGSDIYTSNTQVATSSRSNFLDNGQIGVQDTSIVDDVLANCSRSTSKDAIRHRQSRSSSFSEDPQEFVLNEWSHLDLRDSRGCAETFSSKSSSRTNMSSSSSVKSTSDVASLTQPIDIVRSEGESHGVQDTPSGSFDSYHQLEPFVPQANYFQHGVNTCIPQQTYLQPDPKLDSVENSCYQSQLEPNTAIPEGETMPQAFQMSSTSIQQAIFQPNPFQSDQMHPSSMEVIPDPPRNEFQVSNALEYQPIQQEPLYQQTGSDLLNEQDMLSSESKRMAHETLSYCENYDVENFGDQQSVPQLNPFMKEISNSSSDTAEMDGTASQSNIHESEEEQPGQTRVVRDAWTTFLQREESLIFDIDNDDEKPVDPMAYSHDINVTNTESLSASLSNTKEQETPDHIVDHSTLFPPLQMFSDTDDFYVNKPEMSVKLPPPPRQTQRKRTEQPQPIKTGHVCSPPETEYKQSDVESKPCIGNTNDFDKESGTMQDNRLTNEHDSTNENASATEIVFMPRCELAEISLVSNDRDVSPGRDVSHALFNPEIAETFHSIVAHELESISNKSNVLTGEELEDTNQDGSFLKTSSELLINEDIAPLLVQNDEQVQYVNLKDLPEDCQILRKCLSNTSSTDDSSTSSTSTDSSISESETPYNKLHENGSAIEQG